MSTDGWTAHDYASQSAAWGHAPAGMEDLTRTLLDLCAQGAVLFPMWFLFYPRKKSQPMRQRHRSITTGHRWSRTVEADGDPPLTGEVSPGPMRHGSLQAPHALRVLGAAATPPGHRAGSQAALDVHAAAALCTGRPVLSTPTSGLREAPGGIRHLGRSQPSVGHHRLADQYGLHRPAQPDEPPACRRRRTTRHHAVQKRRRLTPSAGPLSHLL